MKNWIPNNKIRKIILGVSLLSALLYCTGVFLVSREIGQIEKSYTDSESESSKEERARALKTQFETNKESVLALRNFFIQKGDEVSFINKIEEIGVRSSVKFVIDSISVKEKDPDPLKENIVVKINIEGSWTNILSFLNLLEKAYFGALIQNLSLDSKEPGVWFGFLELVIFREK